MVILSNERFESGDMMLHKGRSDELKEVEKEEPHLFHKSSD